MNGINERIHLADVGRFIGRTCKLRGVAGATVCHRLSANLNSGLSMIVGLDAFETTLPVDARVRVWTARDKIANLRPLSSANSAGDRVGVVVPAAELADHVGRLAFVEGGAGKGPHIILAVRVEGAQVHIEMSADELVGTVDKVLELTDGN